MNDNLTTKSPLPYAFSAHSKGLLYHNLLYYLQPHLKILIPKRLHHLALPMFPLHSNCGQTHTVKGIILHHGIYGHIAEFRAFPH